MTTINKKMPDAQFDNLNLVSAYDALELQRKYLEYGDSWKKRGGVGAFMMLARKWDRIETQVQDFHKDILSAGVDDVDRKGIMDDVGDLRRYLMLVEVEVAMLSSKDIADPWANMAKKPTLEEAIVTVSDAVRTADEAPVLNIVDLDRLQAGMPIDEAMDIITGANPGKEYIDQDSLSEVDHGKEL